MRTKCHWHFSFFFSWTFFVFLRSTINIGLNGKWALWIWWKTPIKITGAHPKTIVQKNLGVYNRAYCGKPQRKILATPIKSPPIFLHPLQYSRLLYSGTPLYIVAWCILAQRNFSVWFSFIVRVVHPQILDNGGIMWWARVFSVGVSHHIGRVKCPPFMHIAVARWAYKKLAWSSPSKCRKNVPCTHLDEKFFRSIFSIITQVIAWDWPLGALFYVEVFSTATWPFKFLFIWASSK